MHLSTFSSIYSKYENAHFCDEKLQHRTKIPFTLLFSRGTSTLTVTICGRGC